MYVGDFMSMNRKMIIILCGVLFLLFLFIGYFVINDIVQASVFKSEIARIEKMDIKKDKYDVKLKTIGKHRVVEKNIKNYLYNYSSGLVDISKTMNDKILANLLSIINFKEDGKSFEKSIAYLESTKIDFNKEIDDLISYSDKDRIMDNISSLDMDEYYVSLYTNVMIDGSIYFKLVDSCNELKTTKEEFNTLLDNTLAVLKFLKNNKDNWQLEDDKIMFQNKDLMNQYNLLVQKIKK